jgi:hypothetical protein
MRAQINDPTRWKDGLPKLMESPAGMVCIGNGGGNNYGVGGGGYSSCTGEQTNWTVPAGITEAQFQIWGGGSTGGAGCCCGGAPQGAHGTYVIVQQAVTPGEVYCLCAGGAAQACCCSNSQSCSGCCSYICSSDHGGGSIQVKGGCQNLSFYYQEPGTNCVNNCHVLPTQSNSCCGAPGLRMENSCTNYCHYDVTGQGRGFWCGKAAYCWCCQSSIECVEGRLGYGADVSSSWQNVSTGIGMIPMRGGDMCFDTNAYGYQTTSAVILPDHSYCRLGGGIHHFTSDGNWGGNCCFCGNSDPSQGALPGSGGFPQHTMGGNNSPYWSRGRNGQVIVSYK